MAKLWNMAKPKAKPRPPPGMRREHGKQDKRERISAAAWHLFTTRGFDETTTKAIAEHAGIATGTLFLYARDKTDLLALLFHDRLAHAVDSGFATLPQAPLLDQLVHVFARFFAAYAKHETLGKRFIKEQMSTVGPNVDRVNQLTFLLLGRLQVLLLEAQSRGELRHDAPLPLVAQSLFGLYFMALTAWVIGFATIEMAEGPMLRSSFELLLDGARPRSATTH